MSLMKMTRQWIKATCTVMYHALILFPTISWSLSLNNPSSSAGLLPTAADVSFDQWCDDNGIYRVGVQTVTTPKSLGGRGLFATKSLISGSVVASISANLVIAAEKKDDEDDEDVVEWQVSLTNQIMSLKDDASNEWIQSWHGSGTLQIASFLDNNNIRGTNNNLDDDEFVQEIAGQGKITREGAIAELNKRLNNYNRRLKQLKNSQHRDDADDAAKWYTLVMSRAAYLGKDWDYNTGLLPFFDMLNHCHDANKCNTELMTFGDCLDRSSSSKEGDGDSDGESTSSNVGLDRKDMLLVLTKDVLKGEELLTQYETNVESEQTQLQLLIQYGIPPPPS